MEASRREVHSHWSTLVTIALISTKVTRNMQDRQSSGIRSKFFYAQRSQHFN